MSDTKMRVGGVTWKYIGESRWKSKKLGRTLWAETLWAARESGNAKSFLANWKGR